MIIQTVANSIRTRFETAATAKKSSLPVLKRKPKDYLRQTFFPVPMQYYFKTQNADFWDVHVRRYVQSLQIGTQDVQATDPATVMVHAAYIMDLSPKALPSTRTAAQRL